MLETIIFYCGVAHLLLGLGSLLIPKALNWQQGLVPLSTLLRQMFWTYAGYILGLNCYFGIISVAAPGELLTGSFLSKSLTLLIGLYWLVRVLVQFFYFDRSEAPKGLIFTLGEIGLVGLFVLFTVVYLVAFLHNLAWI